MKKEESEVRKIFIKIRMNEQELKAIKKNQLKTTERSLSNYIRQMKVIGLTFRVLIPVIILPF